MALHNFITGELYQPYNRWNNYGNQRYFRNLSDSGPIQKSSVGRDGFQVCLDVQEFAPNEINVRTVGNTITVDASHEEREDEHGYVARQFTRRYALPEGFNIKDVVTELSSDGILSIKAPPELNALEQGNTHTLQIQQTGPARLSRFNKDCKKIFVKSKEDDMRDKIQNGDSM